MKIKLGSGFSKTILALLSSCAITPAFASTDIALWHSLQGNNADVFKSLVNSYNRSQSDIKVNLRSFDDQESLNAALDKSSKSGSLPTIAHIGAAHTLDNVASRKYIQPFYAIQNNSGLNKIKWFVNKDNAFIYDTRGRLLAFPFMLEVPVMYYNLEAFKKANISPAVPDRAWIELQGQLVQMANNGSRNCPLTSDLPVSINLENLAAVNNQLFASAENGLKAKGLPSFSFNSTYVRHLSLMISWVRTEIMTRPDAGKHAIERFANGECAVLLSNSSHLGEFDDKRGLNFSVSGLPYYPQVTKSPGNPFVGGAGLWVLKSDNDTYKAVANFFNWLAKSDQAVKWHKETGYLPLTHEAFKNTSDSYYKSMGDWKNLVQVYSGATAPTAKGIKVNNYPIIRTKFHEILDSALNGNEPAVTALNNAAAEANRLVLQK